ncbi:hypothetical protein CLOM_g3822, partial [Closterium sp. NIES-68]
LKQTSPTHEASVTPEAGQHREHAQSEILKERSRTQADPPLVKAALKPLASLEDTSTRALGETVPEEPRRVEGEENAPRRSLTDLVPLLMERGAEALTKVVASRVGGLVVLNIVTMLYATNTTIVKGAEEAAGGPLPFCLGRFAIAALALSPLLPAGLSNPTVRRCGVEMGLWTSLAYLSQAFALITTGAGRVSFISTFTMIEVPLVAGLLGARIPPLVWAATASAVAGVLLLEANSEASTLVGDGLALVSAMAFGLQIIRSEKFAKSVPPSATLDLISVQIFTVACCAAVGVAITSFVDLPSTSTALAETAAAVAAAVAAPAAVTASATEFATGLSSSPLDGSYSQFQDLLTILPSTDDLTRLVSQASTWPWLQMAYTGVVSTALCLWLEILAFRHVAASDAAVIYTLDPLYSAVLATIVLHEEWTTLSYVGAALIFGGSVVVQLGNTNDGDDTE